MTDAQRQALEAARASLAKAAVRLGATQTDVEAAQVHVDAVLASLTPPMKVGTFWIQTNSLAASDALIAQEAKRRRYIVLNSWEHGWIPKIKAANPNCKVFVYKCVSSTRSYEPATKDVRLLPAGVSYHTAPADWFLLKSGQRVQWSYPGHWQMDIGHPDYQAAWAINVTRVRELGAWDGVWMDNCLWRRDQYSINPDKYTTDYQLRVAFRSFFSAVTPKLRAADLISIGNMSDARHLPNGWNSYLDAGLDGGFDEWWISVNNNGADLLSEYPEGWSRQVAEIADTEVRGKIALVQPHFPVTDQRALDYAFASYLCGAGANSAFTEANGTDQYGNPTPWRPEYDWDLGTSVSVCYKVAGTINAFRRDFTKGAVVVNANTKDSAALTVQLGGTYLNKSGQSVTTVSLTGCSGAILRKP